MILGRKDERYWQTLSDAGVCIMYCIGFLQDAHKVECVAHTADFIRLQLNLFQMVINK
jgi:hypothetical protein